MKIYNKLISILLVCLMAFTLISCAADNSGSTPEDEEIPAQDTATEPVDAMEVDDAFSLNVASERQYVLYESNGKSWDVPAVDNSGTGGLVLPIAETGTTLSVFRSFTYFDHSISTPDELVCYDIIEANTGIHIDWTVYDSAEQFNLQIVSGDYQDMFWAKQSDYSGGVDKAVEDEVYVNGYSYLPLMPNYVRLLESDPEIQKASATDNHNYFFIGVNSGSQGSYLGTLVRQDWLADLNLDVPTTYDDWYEMLTLFKNEKGATDPLFISSTTGAEATLTAGYSTYPGFYAYEGKEVHYGFTENAMLEYVTMMNKWFSDGLIYRDFLTNSDMTALFAEISSGSAGAGANAYYGLTDMIKMDDDAFELVAVPLPKKSNAEEGKLHFRGAYNGVTTDTDIFLTTGAVAREVAELAAQWIDYRYSEEGSTIIYYGEEGVTWKWGEDGYPHIIEDVWNSNTINGVAYEDMPSVYTDSSVVYGAYIWLLRISDTASPAQLANIEIWSDSANTDWHMPNVSMTVEEGEIYSATYGDIQTYVTESIAKFICGETALEEWDSFVSDVENMGIQDCIDIYQAALDRYNAR